MIEGVTMTIGNREFVVPPLNFKTVRQLKEQIGQMSNPDLAAVMDDRWVDSVVDITLAALQRNYPELQREELEEVLDLANAPKIVQAIMGASGFVQKETMPGEPIAP